MFHTEELNRNRGKTKVLAFSRLTALFGLVLTQFLGNFNALLIL